jgi:hypothetical protein
MWNVVNNWEVAIATRAVEMLALELQWWAAVFQRASQDFKQFGVHGIGEPKVYRLLPQPVPP